MAGQHMSAVAIYSVRRAAAAAQQRRRAKDDITLLSTLVTPNNAHLRAVSGVCTPPHRSRNPCERVIFSKAKNACEASSWSSGNWVRFISSAASFRP